MREKTGTRACATFAAVIDEGVLIRFPFNRAAVLAIKEVPERSFDEGRRLWKVPATASSFGAALRALKPFFEIVLTSSAQALFDRLAEEAKVHKQAALLKDAPEEAIDQVVEAFEMHRRPFLYQARNVLAGSAVPWWGHLLEMGLGKTWCAALIARKRRPDGKRILVVCPKSIMNSWRRELEAMGEKCVVLSGVKGKREERLAGGAPWVIINYEYVIRLGHKLVEEPWTEIIADESTRLANPKAKVSQAMMALRLLVNNAQILTGTPMRRNPLDLWGQFLFLSPTILDFTSYKSFRYRYTTFDPETHEENGWQRLEELEAKISRFSFRALQREVLPDLPPMLYERREVELTGQHADLYEAMKTDMVATLKMPEDQMPVELVAKTVVAQSTRLRQIAGGHLDEEPIPGNVKLTELEGLLDEALSIDGKKVIIWCYFRAEIESVLALCRRINAKSPEKWEAAGFHGDTPVKARATIEERFQNKADPLRVFVGQVETGGFGLTLTAATLNIFYSNSWSHETRLQAEKRALRIGQVGNVTTLDLVAKDTMDEVMLYALKYKKTLADLVTGDRARLLRMLTHGGME